ncbi:MAG TPA: hypothetical protein VIM16_05215 [Mucilaginibacter sp.]|jgi:DNA-damage-inducible protein D
MKRDIKDKLFARRKQLTLKAKDFANELTSHNIIEKNLNTPAQILKERAENKKAVRDILIKRRGKPAATEVR